MSKFKRITERPIRIAIIFSLIVALIACIFTFSFTARADDKKEDIKEYEPVSLNISNPQFSETSGSYPATPSSWTGEALGDGEGSVVSGVVDLTQNVYVTESGGNKTFKLDQYKEYKTNESVPQTIFGAESDYKDTDKKTLLVNSAPSAEVAYAYKSSEMTFEANSFYRVSVWVKTGDFAENTGATVKLNGLGVNCSFININTVRNIAKEDGVPKLTEKNKYGWAEYRFYVRTSASIGKTVTLSLGIGDAVNGGDEDYKGEPGPRLASGYALFDTVSADRISPYDYALETNRLDLAPGRDDMRKSDTRIALDLYEPTYLGDASVGTFSKDDLSDWNINATYDDPEKPAFAGRGATVKLYDSARRITDFEAEDVKFTQNPWAPLGRAEYDAENADFVGGSNGNILLIYSSDKAARGVASPDVTVHRYNYYRFSVWTKADGVSEGDGISIAVKGQKNNTADNNKLNEWYRNLTGDTDDSAHYGWKEQVVYLKGSMLSDLTVHFELWLGTPDSQSSGIAMFDNVTFTELTYKQFTDMSGADGGNVISLDADAEDTGVGNGNFMSVGDYEELTYPMPAADWTYYTASNVNTKGFSKDEVKTDRVKYGIIPVDAASYEEIREGRFIPTMPDPASFAGAPDYSALVISSTEPTAVCYQSPDITVAVDKAYKLTVDMAVDGVKTGYGASLVLKNSDGAVLSTIEGIKSTGKAFNTYTFYIAAPLSEKTVRVEIWLGMGDRINNTLKLSEGHVFVKKVAIAEWTAADDDSTVKEEYETLYRSYKEAQSDKNRIKTLDYGMFEFDSPSLRYYDAYTYNVNGGFGVPYNWTMTAANESTAVCGIFDTENMTGVNMYSGFDKKTYSGNMLYIYNTDKNSTSYTYDDKITLVSNTYYRLDVTLKVSVSEEDRKGGNAIGAGINLTGTVEQSFENIKDTTRLVSAGHEDTRDYEEFRTYTFYISTGADGGDIGLNISFGGDDRTSYIQGKVIVANIAFNSINNTAYETAKANLTSYEKAVELSAAAKDDSDDNKEAAASSISWWVLPTVIFSACLVIAIIIIVIVRLVDKKKKNKKATYTSEYDRAAAAKNLEKLTADNAEDKKSKKNKHAEEEPEKEPAAEEPEQPEAAPEEEPEEKTEEKAEEPEVKKDASDDLDD